MKIKSNNPYWGLSEEARWELYRKEVYDKGFFLRRDFILPPHPKVLAVDTTLMTTLLKKVLEKPLGKEVDRAHHVDEALEHVKKKEYNLILSASRIFWGDVERLMDALSKIPYRGVTLLYTGLFREEAADVMKETHMDGFILKGYGLPHFMKAMGWEEDNWD